MKRTIDDKARLYHILDAIKDIEEFSSDITYKDFIESSLLKNSIVKQLEIIGEAANKLTNDTIEKYPDIEWSNIIGMRNILIHDYFEIDYATVWFTVINDLPPLKENIELILKEFNN